MFFDMLQQAPASKELLRAFELTKKEKFSAPVDEFTVTYTNPDYQLMTDAELQQSVGGVMTYDVESFINYFLVVFKQYGSNKFVKLHEQNNDMISWMLHNYTVIGFNSRQYDLPMCTLAMQGYSAEQLNTASKLIISTEMWASQFEMQFKVKLPKINHVNLIEVAPLQGSLKLYAGRLHCRRMQDLPFDIDAVLTDADKANVDIYCMNDNVNSELLAVELEANILLRSQMSKEYGVDLRSRSDAQVAESVIATELERVNGYKPERVSIPVGTTYFYKVPTYIRFETPALQTLVNTIQNAPLIVSDSGRINMPESIEGKSIAIGNCVYRIGIGGLHSSEKSVFYRSSDDTLIIDRDVASYYPAIILNDELYPRHLGRSFLDVYRNIVQRRLQAKADGNKVVDASLKITINGSFGKLGNAYSLLYAPDLLMQVTITGQLALLMLIEMIEAAGVQVISANTDGMMVKCSKHMVPTFNTAVAEWELRTGFKTEAGTYSAVYSRDVNNYIAVGSDGKIKTKGTYSERGSAGNSILSRNPEAFICNDAVIAYLTNGTTIDDTVRHCDDIKRFVTVRNVKGGAIKSGIYLGKTIRWYQSTEMKGEIQYKLSGNKVPNSDGARPLMEMDGTLPADINYDWYIARATGMLVDLGVLPKPEKGNTVALPFYNDDEYLLSLAS